MKYIPIKWGRIEIRLTSPEECDVLLDRVQRAKEILLETQSGLQPPVINPFGRISHDAFYSFFEQDGLKTGGRGAGQSLFGALARAARENKLPLGLMYCTECRHAVTKRCEEIGKDGRVEYPDHYRSYEVNVATLKARWRDLGRIRGVRSNIGSPLAILIQQLNPHGK